MRRNRHDRTSPVAEEHVISDPDGNPFVVQRIARVGADEDAGLLFREIGPFQLRLARRALTVFAYCRPLLLSHDAIDERMFGRENHVSRAIDCVGSRSKNADRFVRAFDTKRDLRAFASPDPVALQQFDSVRPIEAIEFLLEPIGKGGDPQHPLTHRPPDHWKSADFAFSVDDFFVGQHGAEFRAPVDRHVRDVGESHRIGIVTAISVDRLRALCLRIEPRVVNLEENPLRPFVITRIGRVDLSFPIVGKTNALQLRFEFRHVFARGDRRVLSRFDRILLSGKSERIPAHRMQHVKPAHPLVARDDVGRGVTFRMSDVQTRAARIWKHIEDVELRLCRIEIRIAGVRRMEAAVFFPDRLPFRLEMVEWERLAAFAAHRSIS